MNLHAIAKFHNRGHPEVPVADCGQCKYQQARCQRKRDFTPLEARIEALRINVTNNYNPRIFAYPCKWCEHWHITSHLKGPARTSLARHTEKARRKALAAAYLQQQAPLAQPG